MGEEHRELSKVPCDDLGDGMQERSTGSSARGPVMTSGMGGGRGAQGASRCY